MKTNGIVIVIFLENSQSHTAKNFKDDSGIYIFGHGNPTPNGFILNQQNTEPISMYAEKLATHITNNSSQWKMDSENGDVSMIFLYACYAGEGDDNIAQQLSLLLPVGGINSEHI